MDTYSDIDWLPAIGTLRLEPDSLVDEMYRKRDYSSRQCPHCAEYTLLRRPLQRYLRAFRRIGVDLRHYQCETCKKDAVLRYR